MVFKPTKNKLLLKRTQDSTSSDSGIILKLVEGKTAFGSIVAVGPDTSFFSENSIGSVVMFNAMVPDIKIDSDVFVLLNEEDVYGQLTSGTKLNGISNFKLVHDGDVIVKVNTQQKHLEHSSGIILSANASAVMDRPTNGIVYDVGSAEGCSPVGIGMKVEFEKTAGIDLVQDKENPDSHYVLMDIERIVGMYR